MLIYLIILAAAAARFVPHMPNAAPITAVAIFGAAYLPKKQAIVIPFLARFISDIFLGFFAWPLMVAVYLSHLVGVLFGLWIRKSLAVIPEANFKILDPGSRPFGSAQGALSPVERRMHSAGTTEAKWFKIIFSSLSASVVFFLVTNFAFLYSTYPHDFFGIVASYINGLPFFRGTLAGDLGYTAALFGVYDLVEFYIKKKQNLKVKVLF